MFKDESHIELYMPVWTLEELLAAASAVALPVSSESIKQWYRFFGGSAIYCLQRELRSEKVSLAKEIIEGRIHKITSLAALERMKGDDNIHDIFHSRPIMDEDQGLPDSREMCVASDAIRQLLNRNLTSHASPNSAYLNNISS
jgi:hypothetical protein